MTTHEVAIIVLGHIRSLHSVPTCLSFSRASFKSWDRKWPWRHGFLNPWLVGWLDIKFTTLNSGGGIFPQLPFENNLKNNLKNICISSLYTATPLQKFRISSILQAIWLPPWGCPSKGQFLSQWPNVWALCDSRHALSERERYFLAKNGDDFWKTISFKDQWLMTIDVIDEMLI